LSTQHAHVLNWLQRSGTSTTETALATGMGAPASSRRSRSSTGDVALLELASWGRLQIRDEGATALLLCLVLCTVFVARLLTRGNARPSAYG
jgi:hypothetical protein